MDYNISNAVIATFSIPSYTAMTTTSSANVYVQESRRGIPIETRRLAFQDYHEEHPEVYESIRSLALMTASGPVSVRRLVERLRLGSHLKINNNHIRFYTEKLKEDFPDQAHLFKTRKS